MTDSATTIRPSQRWTTTVDGRRLPELRRHNHLSQEQLADKAAISPATVARLERTPHHLPDPHPGLPCRRSWRTGRHSGSQTTAPRSEQLTPRPWLPGSAAAAIQASWHRVTTIMVGRPG
jgi:DNA-binding XRE family transcriptional regulator